MSPTKASFLKDTDLRDRLLAITKSDWFARVLVHVKAEMMGTAGVSAEHILGAQMFERTLLNLPELEEAENLPVPGPGLIYSVGEELKRAEAAKAKKE